MALPTPLTNFPEHSCCPSSVSSCHLDGEKTALVWLITMTRQFKKLLLLFLIEGAVGSTQLPTDINKHYLLHISFPSNLLDKTEIHSRLVSSHVTHHVFFFQIIFFFPSDPASGGVYSPVITSKFEKHNTNTSSTAVSVRALIEAAEQMREKTSVWAYSVLRHTPTMLFYTSVSLTDSLLLTFY